MDHDPWDRESLIVTDGTIMIPVQGSYPISSGETIEIESRWTFDEQGRFVDGEARVTIEGEAHGHQGAVHIAQDKPRERRP